MASCVLCSETIDLDQSTDYAKLTEKGCIGIQKASKLRKLDTGDITFSEHTDLFVHRSCRSKHINPNAIKAALKRESTSGLDQRPLRSSNLKHTVSSVHVLLTKLQLVNILKGLLYSSVMS